MTYLDTRDLIQERDDLQERADDLDGEPLDEDELAALEALNDLLSGLDGAEDGLTMIPESEFEEYARDFARDIGAIGDDSSWPCYHIDWERAADDLSMDYTTIEYDGTTYYVR